jgi:hypothetical protein
MKNLIDLETVGGVTGGMKAMLEGIYNNVIEN